MFGRKTKENAERIFVLEAAVAELAAQLIDLQNLEGDVEDIRYELDHQDESDIDELRREVERLDGEINEVAGVGDDMESAYRDIKELQDGLGGIAAGDAEVVARWARL